MSTSQGSPQQPPSPLTIPTLDCPWWGAEGCASHRCLLCWVEPLPRPLCPLWPGKLADSLKRPSGCFLDLSLVSLQPGLFPARPLDHLFSKAPGIQWGVPASSPAFEIPPFLLGEEVLLIPCSHLKRAETRCPPGSARTPSSPLERPRCDGRRRGQRAQCPGQRLARRPSFPQAVVNETARLSPTNQGVPESPHEPLCSGVLRPQNVGWAELKYNEISLSRTSGNPQEKGEEDLPKLFGPQSPFWGTSRLGMLI